MEHIPHATTAASAKDAEENKMLDYTCHFL